MKEAIVKTVFLVVLLALVFLAGYQAAQAQGTCTAGMVPTYTASGWTCATPTAPPLPVGSATNMTIANAGATGTTVNRLAKLTGAPSTAVITATSDVDGAIGIVTAGAGTTGNATVAIIGQVTCDFDNATVAGDYVIISIVTAGKCHDGGAAFPTAGATYGRVLSTNGGAGAYVMELMTPDVAFQNAGSGKSKPGGVSGQFQFNDSNVLNGSSGLTYTTGTNTINLPTGAVKINSARLDIGSTTTFGATGEFMRMGDNGTAFLQLFPGEIVLTQPTITQNFPQLALATTWNNAGIIFENLVAGVTDSASPTQASLVSLKVGGTPKFLVYKSGIIQSGGTTRVATQFDKTSATLANVTGLTNTLAHSKTYEFNARLYYDADVTGGAKFAIAGTATGTVVYQINTICNATNLSVITSRQVALAGSAGQAGCTAGYTTITGTLTTTATTGGGTLTVQFAQNTASGTSSVLVGSTFEIKEIL